MSGIYYPQLLDVLRAAGVTCKESSTTNGWQTRARGSGGFPKAPIGVFWHHTASQTSPANDLSYMIQGSPDAPVGNMLLDRDGVVWPIAAGASNCAGKGGPWTFSRGTCPQDNGNTYCWQIEAANNGVGEAWPQAQIDAYFKASNALNALFGNLPTDIVGHAHYTSRKIDPAVAGSVQGPWKPRSINSSATWNLDDMRNECTRRATVTPPDPVPPDPPIPAPIPSTEDYDVAFIILNNDTGQPALVYGDKQVVGLAGPDLPAYEAQFGKALPTDAVVWQGFVDKSKT